VGARFSKVPAHYPDPGNPGHYMNVLKTPTTLNDGQQQPVDNFAPRANLKRFFKEAASRYFVEKKHVLEYIRHLEELQIVSTIRENSGSYSFLKSLRPTLGTSLFVDCACFEYSCFIIRYSVRNELLLRFNKEKVEGNVG
jgi:hypothetical protein